MLTSAQISQAIGRKFPVANIDKNWPLVEAALADRGISSPACEIAAAATIAVETGSFAPVKERGGPAYLKKLYWDDERRRGELGNTAEVDAFAYCGRGFVQITGRANYRNYGVLIGTDIEADPTRALDPAVAAAVLSGYFWQRKINEIADQACAAQSGADAEKLWQLVRRRVNGGLNGWGDFRQYVAELASLAGLNCGLEPISIVAAQGEAPTAGA